MYSDFMDPKFKGSNHREKQFRKNKDKNQR